MTQTKGLTVGGVDQSKKSPKKPCKIKINFCRTGFCQSTDAEKDTKINKNAALKVAQNMQQLPVILKLNFGTTDLLNLAVIPN